MKLLSLSISGFRGIENTSIRFREHDVLVGPNGSGKSTIIDALSLVFGRTRLVRDLTEHDFHSSCPQATSRIRIVATLGGFPGKDPGDHDNWFRDGRAVPKWWSPETETAEPEPRDSGDELCAQVGFVARFDLEELRVDTLRYFHDDHSIIDPFRDDSIQQVPIRLLDDIGYYVLPASRTWERAASFASELFRKAVATVGGIPAETVLNERDRLRSPSEPLEKDQGLLPLARQINKQLEQLLPEAPRFQLRVTATDSDSLLRALIPHYEGSVGIALPASRHGMGLLSLQTFVLLLELGRRRRSLGKPFLLAMEEPELHVPPGLQRRLVAQAVSIAEQTICTSHAPRVAAWYPATSVQILDRRATGVSSTPLLDKPLGSSASNAMRKLYQDSRSRVVEALMYHRVLIPEGRSDYEWLRLLADMLETSDLPSNTDTAIPASFGTVVGVVPTHNAAVEETFRQLRRLRSGLIPLVDGDRAGDSKVEELCNSSQEVPELILQWRDGWAIEDAVGWILKGAEDDVLIDLQNRLERAFSSFDELIDLFKVKEGPGRLKTDYLAFEEVVSAIGSRTGCRDRTASLMRTLTDACLGRYRNLPHIRNDAGRSTKHTVVIRLFM